jgi:RNA polymerase sigma-70 factor (ECF subfamily)
VNRRSCTARVSLLPCGNSAARPVRSHRRKAASPRLLERLLSHWSRGPIMDGYSELRGEHRRKEAVSKTQNDPCYHFGVHFLCERKKLSHPEVLLAIHVSVPFGSGERGKPKVSEADEAMSRYANGDDAAFDIVYEAVAPRLEARLRQRVRERERREDIIQDTFVQMHRGRGTFIIGAAVMPWAYAIAERLFIASMRRTPRERYVDMDDPTAVPRAALASAFGNGEEALVARETEERLAGAYRCLTDDQRAAYDLVKREGMSHAEAACILGTTILAIKLRVHRVYLALRAAVKGGHSPQGVPR